MRIFIHGGGIGDEAIYLSEQDFQRIYYNDIGGSETVRFALKRLEARNLFNVPEAPVKVSFDPLGRGIYESRRAFEESTELYNLIISCNVFGWVKHPMYTIHNLGRLLTEDGILAIIPAWGNYPLKENEWMIAVNLYQSFMEQMGFKAEPVQLETRDRFYPVFRARWASHNKYKEEWII